MKNLKTIPSHLNKKFGLCIYSELNDEIEHFAEEHSLVMEKNGKYINFFPTKDTDFSKMFDVKKYKFVDGFSPNLNKYLHVGHFVNFITAKAFQKLEIGEQYVSILGDTLTGDISKNEALENFHSLCNKYDYKVDKLYFASEMQYNKELEDGEGEYAGTKIITSNENKVVMIKKDGSTTYFYQDLALAEELNNTTLYLTGNEQNNHFEMLSAINPNINHVGFGLLKLKNVKMSTRAGNVIYLSEILDMISSEFDNNKKLAYNIFAGFILNKTVKSDKSFDLAAVKQFKNSLGLYLSYTMARLISAGVDIVESNEFLKQELKYSYYASKFHLEPYILFKALHELCKEINLKYESLMIKDNPTNREIFSLLLQDLNLGMKKLGLFQVFKI